jgi:hypothetical protein
MITNYARQFYVVALAISATIDNHSFRELGIRLYGADKIHPLPEDTQQQIRRGLDATAEACKVLGLDNSAKQIERILNLDSLNSDQAAKQMEALRDRLLDELEGFKFLHLTSRMAHYYESDFPFGEKVGLSFPKATFDIEEAAKCFALNRNTACVMHLMRALEAPLRAIGVGLGIPNAINEAKNSWGGILRIIREKIQEKNKTALPDWLPQRGFYEDAHAHLSSVKTAWRDTSMHLDRKYDDKDSTRIYSAVKDFMERLADHLDESGNFTP